MRDFAFKGIVITVGNETRPNEKSETAARGPKKLQTRTVITHTHPKPSLRAGFTLVETLIVASLVGLLAFIAIPNYIRTRSNAAKAACISNLRQIDQAVQQWATELKRTSSSTVTFSDIRPFLRYSVVCPAGGASFADSYSIATVASEPLCLRVPLSHLFPGSGLDLITSTGNPNGNPPPISPPGPGTGPGNGNGNGSATRPGRPTFPPNAGNQGNGSGAGNSTANPGNNGGANRDGSNPGNGSGSVNGAGNNGKGGSGEFQL